MKFLLVPVFLIFTQLVSAQKYSNEFLSIGVGARAQGMGNAGLASVGDVTSAFWNPAGLANVQNLQLGYMHSEWFAGIAQYDYGAVAAPIADKRRALAFSFIRLGVDNIPNTLSLYNDDGTVNYSNVKTFSAADYAFLLSYAQKIGKKDNFTVGGNVKVIHRLVGSFSNAWGFGIDLGAQYKLKNWRFGLVAKDITGTFNAWSFNLTDRERQVLGSTGNDIPVNSVEVTNPRVNFGVAYQKDFVLNKKKVAEGKKEKYFNLLAEFNMDMTTDGKRNVLISANPISFDPYLGLEMGYNNLVFLRTGMNNIQQVRGQDNSSSWTIQPNVGVGLKVWKFRLDYALANIGSASGSLYSHVISVLMDIEKKKKG